MDDDSEIRNAIVRAREASAREAERLEAAGVEREALAEFVPARRGFLRRKPAVMRPVGEAWRVASILLAPDGTMYALGHATRSAERGRPGYQSVSREERREIAAAALRGGYPVGTPVNYDAAPLPLDPDDVEALRSAPQSLPVGFAEGEVRVRWRIGAPLSGAPALSDFLRERVDLLIDPPFARD
ncbi:hypothetical protein [Leucobacter sp. USHLN153]|uniref:hypothetical protein n=1 Tax=Leucobacter sp. USHLN153 TaxID=3081268 RepID=UPI0030159A66